MPMKFRSARTTLAFVGCMLLGSSFAFAQATRTWVSGVGDDANPCSRTAPCKTFAGAISKTASGGEIDALDPGGYGGVTITKPITIAGVGTTLGINGIRVLNATSVVMDNVNVFGFGTNGVISEGTSKVFMTGGVLSNNNIAVHSIGNSNLSVENSALVANNIAVQPDLGSTLNLSNNAVYNNKTGFACGTGGTLGSDGKNRKSNN